MTTTDYTIYTIANCKYCDDAKQLLREHGKTFHDIAVDVKPEMAKFVMEMSGSKTWPQIVYRGAYIGGYTELKGMLGEKE